MIGDKILSCRKKAGLSQEALAQELGISRQAVSRWETGEAVPDTEKIIQLSRLFEVTTDYLLLDEVEEPQTEAPAEKMQTDALKEKRRGLRVFFEKLLLFLGLLGLIATLIGAGGLCQHHHGMVHGMGPLRHSAVPDVDACATDYKRVRAACRICAPVEGVFERRLKMRGLPRGICGNPLFYASYAVAGGMMIKPAHFLIALCGVLRYNRIENARRGRKCTLHMAKRS